MLSLKQYNNGIFQSFKEYRIYGFSIYRLNDFKLLFCKRKDVDLKEFKINNSYSNLYMHLPKGNICDMRIVYYIPLD